MYLALQRLEEDGLIQEAKGLTSRETDRRRRRFYRLTRFGRTVMALEAERLARQLAIAVDKDVIDAARLRSS